MKLSESIHSNPEPLKLRATGRGITEIDILKNKLTDILILYASHNSIETIDNIIQFKRLEQFYIEYNSLQFIEDLKPLANLTYLKYFSVLGNPLTAQPYWYYHVFFYAPNLQKLNGKSIKSYFPKGMNISRIKDFVKYERELLLIIAKISAYCRQLDDSDKTEYNEQDLLQKYFPGRSLWQLYFDIRKNYDKKGSVPYHNYLLSKINDKCQLLIDRGAKNGIHDSKKLLKMINSLKNCNSSNFHTFGDKIDKIIHKFLYASNSSSEIESEKSKNSSYQNENAESQTEIPSSKNSYEQVITITVENHGTDPIEITEAFCSSDKQSEEPVKKITKEALPKQMKTKTIKGSVISTSKKSTSQNIPIKEVKKKSPKQKSKGKTEVIKPFSETTFQTPKVNGSDVIIQIKQQKSPTSLRKCNTNQCSKIHSFSTIHLSNFNIINFYFTKWKLMRGYNFISSSNKPQRKIISTQKIIHNSAKITSKALSSSQNNDNELTDLVDQFAKRKELQLKIFEEEDVVFHMKRRLCQFKKEAEIKSFM